uniref:Heat shock protein 21 n=1 Tax=Lasioderma serricorne TaxID=295660 RepID=A0A8F2Q4U8_9COLE|nr:heat shock protein 21 [Lasioderma serricorne]
MSLLPYIWADPFDMSRPSRILDQHFGLGMDADDLLAPLTLPREVRSLLRSPSGYYRPWRTSQQRRDAGSTVRFDSDKFQVNLDVQQFAPEEITVKACGEDTITVEGKHEEKQDEHGFISRHFVRKYILPKGHDISQTVSSLSSDGVLTITAPRLDADVGEMRNIPIAQTGKPSKALGNKSEGEGDKK